jgi:ketosteroid isomerase-like protein
MATPEQERNLELVRGGLEDWIAGDHEAAMATFTDDVEVYVPNELGNAGTYRGLEQFKSWFEGWDEAWSSFEMAIESIESVGDRHVVAMIRSQAVGQGSGIEVENLLGWVMSVRDGRMEFLSLQPDRESAIKLVEEREGGDAPVSSR